jgi:glycosyltransferase involved in cell wall biosynthesis
VAPVTENIPSVTIITPVLDGARFLRDNLSSVRSQDYPRVEHIVVDGGSTDGTHEILSEMGSRWISEPDRGMFDAINKGIRLAQGDIVAYQNADDRYVAPGAITAAVECLRSNPCAEVVYGDYRYITANGKPLRRMQPRGRDFSLARLLRYNYVPPHSTFVRRRVVTEQGFWFDPSLRFAGDWEWFLRLGRAGKVFMHLPKILSEFRLHEGSMTSTVGWRRRLAEWRCICRRERISLMQLLLHEAFLMPLARRLGCWV